MLKSIPVSLIYQSSEPHFYLGAKGNKEDIIQLFNLLYNHNCTDNDPEFPSEVFGYITGRKEQLLRGLTSYFTIIEPEHDSGTYARAKSRATDFIATIQRDVVVNYKSASPTIYEQPEERFMGRPSSFQVEDLLDMEDAYRD